MNEECMKNEPEESGDRVDKTVVDSHGVSQHDIVLSIFVSLLI